MARRSSHVRPVVLVVALAVLPAHVHAQDASDAGDGGAPAARTQLAVEARHESLDSGMADWRALRISLSRGGGWAGGWHAALVHEERFGLEDTGLELGGAFALDPRWMLQLDAGAAPDAAFLPRWNGEARLVRRLDGGWLASGGLRRARYHATTVDKVALDLERYVGQWRLGYGLDVARLRGERLANHEVSVDRYYGERNVAGLRVGIGEDAIQVPDGSLLPDDARAVWVRGTHWFAASWAIDWAAGHVGQDATYDRDWVQLGIRLEF